MSLLLCTACETDWEICGCPISKKSTVPINVVLNQNKKMRRILAELLKGTAESAALARIWARDFSRDEMLNLARKP